VGKKDGDDNSPYDEDEDDHCAAFFAVSLGGTYKCLHGWAARDNPIMCSPRRLLSCKPLCIIVVAVIVIIIIIAWH
jgi:hypothetical protein